MTTTTKEMLARIDERTLEIEKKLDEFSGSLGQVRQEVDEVRRKSCEHDIVLYGRGGREGMVKKVERHDRAFWKAVGIGGFLIVVVEFLKEFLFK